MHICRGTLRWESLRMENCWNEKHQNRKTWSQTTKFCLVAIWRALRFLFSGGNITVEVHSPVRTLSRCRLHQATCEADPTLHAVVAISSSLHTCRLVAHCCRLLSTFCLTWEGVERMPLMTVQLSETSVSQSVGHWFSVCC